MYFRGQGQGWGPFFFSGRLHDKAYTLALAHHLQNGLNTSPEITLLTTRPPLCKENLHSYSPHSGKIYINRERMFMGKGGQQQRATTEKCNDE